MSVQSKMSQSDVKCEWVWDIEKEWANGTKRNAPKHNQKTYIRLIHS